MFQSQMLQFIHSYLGVAAPTTPRRPTQSSVNESASTSASLDSIKMTFRITGIPPGKTEDDVQAVLEKDRPNFTQVSPKIIICPGIRGAHQSATVTLHGSEDIVKMFAKGNTNSTERYVPWDEENDIKIDSHFRGLTQLNQCDSPEADLVAVTGLNSHAYESWRHNDTKRMWLQEFLPKDMDNRVRVMVYGYDSSLYGSSTSTAGMMDFIRKLIQDIDISRSADPARPLIMVGHSLGCIIVARALLFCTAKPEYSPILNATKLLMFFGAPHRGLNTRDFELMVENITNKLRKSRMDDIVRSIQENSSFLESYSEEMVDIFNRYTIVSFYEGHQTTAALRSTNGDNVRSGEDTAVYEMVRKCSAALNIPNEVRIYVDSDHWNLVKFPNKSNETYLQVLKHIKDKLNESKASLKTDE